MSWQPTGGVLLRWGKKIFMPLAQKNWIFQPNPPPLLSHAIPILEPSAPPPPHREGSSPGPAALALEVGADADVLVGHLPPQLGVEVAQSQDLEGGKGTERGC